MRFVWVKAPVPKGSPKGGVGFNKCQDIQILPAYNPKDGKPISSGGKTYEEWGTAWWIWHYRFNNSFFYSAQGPRDLLQPKNAIFLAYPDGISTTLMRSVQVPKNSYVFFPLISYIHWYNPGGTDDLPGNFKSFKILGINISTLNFTKNADVSALVALESFVANTTNTILSLDVDGCKLDPKKNGLIATSPGQEFLLPVNQDNDVAPGDFDAAYVGYFALLPPFKKPGKHTVDWTALVERSGPALAALGVGYNATIPVTYSLDIV